MLSIPSTMKNNKARLFLLFNFAVYATAAQYNFDETTAPENNEDGWFSRITKGLLGSLLGSNPATQGLFLNALKTFENGDKKIVTEKQEILPVTEDTPNSIDSGIRSSEDSDDLLAGLYDLFQNTQSNSKDSDEDDSTVGSDNLDGYEAQSSDSEIDYDESDSDNLPLQNQSDEPLSLHEVYAPKDSSHGSVSEDDADDDDSEINLLDWKDVPSADEGSPPKTENCGKTRNNQSDQKPPKTEDFTKVKLKKVVPVKKPDTGTKGISEIYLKTRSNLKKVPEDQTLPANSTNESSAPHSNYLFKESLEFIFDHGSVKKELAEQKESNESLSPEPDNLEGKILTDYSFFNPSCKLKPKRDWSSERLSKNPAENGHEEPKIDE